MSYRNDHDAALARISDLEHQVVLADRENERLQAELAKQGTAVREVVVERAAPKKAAPVAADVPVVSRTAGDLEAVCALVLFLAALFATILVAAGHH